MMAKKSPKPTTPGAPPPSPVVASAPPLPHQPKTKRVSKKALEQSKTYDLQWFPERWLGEKPYGWQFDVLKALNRRESRVALKAANGSGKTSMIAAAAVVWHVVNFPESLCVCTAGVFR